MESRNGRSSLIKNARMSVQTTWIKKICQEGFKSSTSTVVMLNKIQGL